MRLATSIPLSLILVAGAAAGIPSEHVRHAIVTLQPCGTNQKTSYTVVITETPPSSVADGKRFTRFTMVSKDAGKTAVTIQKDSHGWPISFQMKGAGTDTDPISAMLFMMRQPLWSPKRTASDWNATIANPVAAGQKIKVACHLTHPIQGQKTVLLEQKTALVSIMPGMKAQVTSTLVYDSIAGRAKTVKVNVGINTSSKDGQLMFFEEQD